MKRLYTIKQTAKLLNKHWKTIYFWVQDKKIIATKVGRFWQITKEEIEYISTHGLRG